MSSMSQQLTRFREDKTVKKAFERMKRNGHDLSWDHASWEEAANACLELYKQGHFLDILSEDETKEYETMKMRLEKVEKENEDIKEKLRYMKMKTTRQTKISKSKEDLGEGNDPSSEAPAEG